MRIKLFIPFALLLTLIAGHFYTKKMSRVISYFSDIQLRHQKRIQKIPDDPTFAGEKVYFKNPEAYLRYYRELRINTTRNSSTRLLLKNASLWLPGIEEILVKHNVPSDFQYLAVAESGLDNSARSHRGAAGFWQFTETTAAAYGLEINDEVDERFHFQKATRAACQYFHHAYKEFGSWTSAAAAYNRGITGLQKAFRNQSVNSYYDLELNKETSRYIYRILALRDIIVNPSKYKMKKVRFRLPHTQQLKIDTTIHHLDHLAHLWGIDTTTLKAYNPWLLKNSLTIKTAGAAYYITIPKVRAIHPAVADTNRSKTSKSLTIKSLVAKEKSA